MTSKDRVFRAFRHKEADRTPVFEYCLFSDKITRGVLGRPSAVLQWDDCFKEKGWEGTVRQIAVDMLDTAEFFGFDMMCQTPNPGRPRTPPPSPAKNEEPDDPAEKVRLRNQRRASQNPEPSDETLLVYKFLKEEMAARGLELPILAPAYAHGVWTDIDLMQTMVLDPETAHEHFALATRDAEAKIKKYASLGLEIAGIGGDFAGNTPLISPECYRTFIMPELKKLSELARSLGMLAVNASDGNLWGVIDDFLIGSGVDGYLEIDLHAGMELKKLKDSYGDRITFLGNMDCGNTLSFASPETVRAETLRCIEAGLGNGGHIFTASNAITNSVPPENYFAMTNAYREYFNLPKLKLDF